MNYDAKLTEFQKKVLKVVSDIPFGETRSYKWVAQQIGNPLASRAVGGALRANPFPVVIPCHRVIHADGTLGAYAGRYDGTKEELLKFEKDTLNGRM